MAKKSASGGKKRESLIVTSKIKAFIKSQKCMTASESLETINSAVYNLLANACGRAKANRRTTVKSQDL